MKNAFNQYLNIFKSWGIVYEFLKQETSSHYVVLSIY
jgi:hypothetical protein